MINSINSVAQSTEPKTTTVVPFRPDPSEDNGNVVDLKQVEKEQTEELQGKSPQELAEEPKEKNVEVSQEMLDELANDIEILHSIGLNFAQHKDSGRTMVSVMNRDTDEVIREIPSEDILDMAVKMEEMVGLLFDEKV